MISDAQFLSLASLFWTLFTFIPLLLIGMHHYGHFKADKPKGHKCNEAKMILYSYANQSMCAYRIIMFFVYGAAAACITTYWSAANPAECTVSDVLYHFTVAAYIGFVILKSMCVVALFHGTDTFTAKLLAGMTFCAIGFTVVSVIFTLGQYDGDKPSTFLYCVVVFSLQALGALWYLRFVFKHAAHTDEYNAQYAASRANDDGYDY